MARKQTDKTGETPPKPKTPRKTTRAAEPDPILEARLEQLESQMLEMLQKYDEQQAQIWQSQEALELLRNGVAPPPPPAEPLVLPVADGDSTRVVELEAELEDLQRLLVDGEQRQAELEDTLRSREEELAELANYNEELQNRITELESQHTVQAVTDAAETHVLLGEMQESNTYLRKVNAHLEETYAEAEDGLRDARQQVDTMTRDYREQVRMTESLARELAHTHRWLDEAEVVLDALQPPPPALASPIRRLRQTLQDLRDGKLPIVEDMDRVRGLERQVASLQADLVETRQRLLASHADQDKRG